MISGSHCHSITQQSSRLDQGGASAHWPGLHHCMALQALFLGIQLLQVRACWQPQDDASSSRRAPTPAKQRGGALAPRAGHRQLSFSCRCPGRPGRHQAAHRRRPPLLPPLLRRRHQAAAAAATHGCVAALASLLPRQARPPDVCEMMGGECGALMNTGYTLQRLVKQARSPLRTSRSPTLPPTARLVIHRPVPGGAARD